MKGGSDMLELVNKFESHMSVEVQELRDIV